MEYKKLQTDIAIIGDGIAALSLAYIAAKNNLKCIILGKNISGATHAATGFMAPRPDYMLRDLELVRRTAYECGRWRGIFDPQIVKPKLFLIPIGPELPESAGKFEALLDFYDKETAPRLCQLPSGYFKVNQTILEKIEPNLKRNRFDGALALWEFTVDAGALLKKMREAIANMGVEKINIKEMLGCEKMNNRISELMVMNSRGQIIRINQPRVVVNAAGSWISDVWKVFGISLPMKLNIGVQAKVPGRYLKSGIITFGPDKKYVVCLQKDGYVQIGPTNGTDNIGYLYSVFAGLIEGPVSEASFLKSGYRIKPFAVDTQRPVIWNHKSHGFDNFYSLHPGKMVLALMAADELLAKVKKDGWLDPDIFAPDCEQEYALDGTSPFKSNLKICRLVIKSFVALMLHYFKFLVNPALTRKCGIKQKPSN